MFDSGAKSMQVTRGAGGRRCRAGDGAGRDAEQGGRDDEVLYTQRARPPAIGLMEFGGVG